MILRNTLSPALEGELVAFHGELDVAAAPDLRALLAEIAADSQGALLIDLCDCTFIDSLGIAAIVGGSKAMLERGRAVAVAVSSPQVRRILALTGADELLPIHWSREEALGWLAEHPRTEPAPPPDQDTGGTGA